MKPNAKSVTTALRKVKDLPYTIIANGHGPILKCVHVLVCCTSVFPRTCCTLPPLPMGAAPTP